MNEIVYVDHSVFAGTLNTGRAATIGRDPLTDPAVQVNNYQTYSVRWSPYGDMLALTSYNSGRVQITDTAGTVIRTLNPTGPSAGVYLPGGDFSPDNTEFAIGLSTAAIEVSGQRSGISVFPLDGSPSRFVDLGPMSRTTIQGGNGSGQSVLWLSDGRFAYIAEEPGGYGQQEIRVCNADGSGITTILSASELSADLDWWGLCDTYADGTLLVMYTPQDSPKGQLIKCGVSGSPRGVIYEDDAGTLIGNYLETGAAISTDGTLIAVVCNDYTLRTMPAGGGALSASLADARHFGSVSWKGAPPLPAASSIAAGPATTGLIRLS